MATSVRTAGIRHPATASGRLRVLGPVVALCVVAALAGAASAGRGHAGPAEVDPYLPPAPAAAVAFPRTPPTLSASARHECRWAGGVAYDTMRLRWAAVPGASRYRVSYAANSVDGPWTVAATTSGTSARLRLGTANGQRYGLRVEPVGRGGAGPASNVVSLPAPGCA